MSDHLIIVAGGSGTRMGAALPKQFLDLCGRPVIMRTLDRFAEYNRSLNVVLVLPEDYFDLWLELEEKYSNPFRVHLAAGGANRFESVKSGLSKLDKAVGIVGVHDAVRPFPSIDVIEECYNTARGYGNAVPAIDVHQSMRMIEGGESKVVDRSKFRLIQTPQCFEISLLRDAYKQAYDLAFTDDASVVEQLGVSINLIQGNRENFKITTKSDLLMACALID